MRSNTAQASDVTTKGVLIFALLTAGVVGALWWASVNGAPGRAKQASLDASAITAESTKFCTKHVPDAGARAECAADLKGVRDNHLKRFTDSIAGWL